MQKRTLELYVDRVTKQWIVLDPQGNFWSMPCVDDPWRHRTPFSPSDETDLDPVPGHYKYMLGLPFYILAEESASQ